MTTRLPLTLCLFSFLFSSFAKQIYPSNFVPSPCHRWIKLLEDRGVVSLCLNASRLTF